MDPWDLIKWATPVLVVFIGHLYRAGIRERSILHRRIDRTNAKMEERDDRIYAKLEKIADKIDAHHAEWVERIAHLEAKVNGKH